MKQYAIEENGNFFEYLKRKRKDIEFFVTDADITGVNIQAPNDTIFFEIVMDYAKWIEEVKNDKTINKNGNGNLYHA